jgi:hypothetical protein
MFKPWVQRDNLTKFNKVIVTNDPTAQGGDLQVLPVWWPAAAETKFLNVLKEFAAGSNINAPEITYENAQHSIDHILRSKMNVFAKFEEHMLPKEKIRKVNDLKSCKGYIN